MIDKPLDCVGTAGPVGKHDFRSSEGYQCDPSAPEPDLSVALPLGGTSAMKPATVNLPAAIDLARRIKAYQAHVAGASNQKRFIELCDDLFAVFRHIPPQT